MNRSLLTNNKFRLLTFSGITIFLISGCLTGKESQPAKKIITAPEAPGPETSRPSAGMAPLVLAPVPDSQIAEFASRHALSVASLTEADEQLLKRIPNKPQPGSVHEAALVLGVVKSLNPISTINDDIQESDLTNAEGEQNETSQARDDNSATAQRTANNSLEKAASLRGIDLPSAVAINPFLQGATVVRLITMAAEKGGNSPNFKDRLRSAVNKQISEWRSLATRYGEQAPPVNNMPPALSDQGAPVDPNANNEAIVAGTDAVHDLHSSSVVLNEGIRLAEEGQWDKAISTLQRIDKDSPLFQASKDKVLEFSNSAVREMRLQAARAFATANQANDNGTKFAYLQKAKDLLEGAINKYPESNQLGTVRENLTVINRDLDYLRSK